VTILSHPSLSVANEEPTTESKLEFSIPEKAKVVVDYGALEKKKQIQVDSLVNVVLKLADKHGLQEVKLTGYTVEILSHDTEVDAENPSEPPAKRQKKERVQVVPSSTKLFVAGDEKMILLLDDLQQCNTGTFQLLWFLRAEVDKASNACALRLSGLAVIPGSKGIEMSMGSDHIVADASEEHLKQLGLLEL
jgi:hypothetical protein